MAICRSFVATKRVQLFQGTVISIKGALLSQRNSLAGFQETSNYLCSLPLGEQRYPISSHSRTPYVFAIRRLQRFGELSEMQR